MIQSPTRSPLWSAFKGNRGGARPGEGGPCPCWALQDMMWCKQSWAAKNPERNSPVTLFSTGSHIHYWGEMKPSGAGWSARWRNNLYRRQCLKEVEFSKLSAISCYLTWVSCQTHCVVGWTLQPKKRVSLKPESGNPSLPVPSLILRCCIAFIKSWPAPAYIPRTSVTYEAQLIGDHISCFNATFVRFPSLIPSMYAGTTRT